MSSKFDCPVCGGDCGAANPPVTFCHKTIERTDYDERGLLDEVVTNGGAHLERMSGNDKRGKWFLSMRRADNSEFCVWFDGAITMTEERSPR